MTDKTCLNCGHSSAEIPLLTLEYRGQTYHLCPQCLPVMIHQPHKLAGKLPGAENFEAAGHQH